MDNRENSEPDVPPDSVLASAEQRARLCARREGLQDCDADDLIQDTWLSVRTGWKRPRTVIPWIDGIVRNKSRRLWRHKAQTPQDQVFFDEIEDAGHDNDPICRATRTETREAFDRMASKHEQEGEALYLRYDQGHTFDEVGAHLGISKTTAQELVQRARDLLRKELGA